MVDSQDTVFYGHAQSCRGKEDFLIFLRFCSQNLIYFASFPKHAEENY